MATHSSVLAWRTPRMAEPGGLSMGLHRVGHNWSNLAAAAAYGVPTECSIVKGCSLKHSVPFKTSATYYYLPYLSTVISFYCDKIYIAWKFSFLTICNILFSGIKYIHQNTHTHIANTNAFSILHNYPYYLYLKHFHHPQNKTGFQGAATCEESACQFQKHKRHGFDLWVGTIPWSRKWQPTPIFLPGEFHGQRSPAGYPMGSQKVGHKWATAHTHTQTVHVNTG